MNEDWMTELEPGAGEELERQLDRFARLRLDASPGQAKRARSAVMEAAWRRKLEGRVTASAASDDVLEPSVTAAALTVVPAAHPSTSTPARGLFGGWGSRRLGMSFAAAILAGLTIGSSVFAASRAGGPLYESRLALEEITLPADARARVEAELGFAQDRLADLLEGVAKGDGGAITASVAAYLATLDELDEATGGPADRARTAIQQHRAVLQGILAQVPDDARSGIENALAMSSTAIDRLSAVGTQPPVTTGAGGGQGGSGTGGGGTNPNIGPGSNSGGGTTPTTGAGSNGGTGGKPDATPRPVRTPKPAKTPAPVATDKPTSKGPQGGRP